MTGEEGTAAGSAPLAGVVLAAGRGSRMGGPKVLLRDAGGMPWVARAAGALAAAGCGPVVVVLGAQAEDARALLPSGCVGVVAERWEAGLGESLRTGLAAVVTVAPDAVAVVVTLVDLPDQQSEAVVRVAAGAHPGRLARAAYDGVPGHPVLVGRDHWGPLTEQLAGDAGARDYLRHRAVVVDCTDLGGGEDVDTPAARADRAAAPRSAG